MHHDLSVYIAGFIGHTGCKRTLTGRLNWIKDNSIAPIHTSWNFLLAIMVLVLALQRFNAQKIVEEEVKAFISYDH